MVSDVTRERIRNALSGVLLPLARTLLRCGVGYTEFAELAKHAFVEAASRDYGVRNRPTNIARVAVMTGLSRKEVARIRGVKKRVRFLNRSVTLPAAILNEWHLNRHFCDRYGVPLILPVSGKGVTFSSLVRCITSDTPPGVLQRELIRSGAARMIGGAKILATKRHFVPDSVNEKVLVGLELGLRRLAETIEFNSNPDNAQGNRFQRFIEGPKIQPRDLAEVRKEVYRLLTKFSVALDDSMTAYGTSVSTNQKKKIAKTVQPGVGLYYFDDAPDKML
jgi:hypothetical protein